MFNPYVKASNGADIGVAGYDPPASSWAGWDAYLGNTANAYWVRSAMLTANNQPQGQCQFSHSMYLADQYGDEKQYSSCVEGATVDFTNKLEGEINAPINANPKNCLLAYIGFVTLAPVNTSANTNIAVEISATLETKFFRVTLAAS